jgi:hypothetical protein
MNSNNGRARDIVAEVYCAISYDHSLQKFLLNCYFRVTYKISTIQKDI